MRYALIGCGRIAVNHLEAAVKNGYEVVALCDIKPEAPSALLTRCGIDGKSIRQYTDYQEMLRKENPEVVAVATESGNHAQIAETVLEQGIPLLLEKPMALSLKDADRIITIGEEKHVPFAVCQQNRYNLTSQLVRKAIDKGYFGKISHIALTVRWSRNADYYRQGDWRGTWEEDGGALMNQCIHGCDLLRWFGGNDIDTVSGTLCNRFHPYLPVEDIGLATVRFKNGIIGTIEGTTNAWKDDFEETITIFGEKGMVRLNGKVAEQIGTWEFEEKEAMELRDTIHDQNFTSVYGNGHASVYADMKEALADKRPPYVDCHDGRRSLELVLAIYKSHKEGRPVSLPLSDFSTMEMKGVKLL